VAQGAGSTAYTSLASVLQLGTKSPRLPECSDTVVDGCVSNATARSGDLKYVGAGAAPGDGGYGDGWLWFGISTFGDWAKLGTVVNPYVDFDVNGDGEADYEVYGQQIDSTDLLEAFLVDLNSGDLVDIVPVNFNDGSVDTNQFDSNVLLLPVRAEAIGVTNSDESFPITYVAGMFDSGYTESDIDSTAPIKFDVADPGVSTDEPLYQDQGKVGIPYTLGSKTAAKGTTALVLHLHGADGKRAEVVKLAGSGNKSKTVTPPTNR